jgi:hypothetical protein
MSCTLLQHALTLGRRQHNTSRTVQQQQRRLQLQPRVQ